MKTLILTTALVILASLSFAQSPQSSGTDSSSYVSSDINVTIFQINDSMVSVKMAKKPGELVKVLVKENGNNLLYSRRIKKYGSADLLYDLNQFPEGEYVFEIVKDKKVVYSQKIIRKNVSKDFVANK